MRRRRPAQEHQDRLIWLRVGVSHRSALSLPLVSRQWYLPVVESPDTWHVPVFHSRGCIPLIPRAAPTQLEYRNSCTKPTTPGQDLALPSFYATLSYHLYSPHDLFWSYGRLRSGKHSCYWAGPQVSS